LKVWNQDIESLESRHRKSRIKPPVRLNIARVITRS
jgi:hypothetical protein